MTSKQSQNTIETGVKTSLSPGLYIVATPIGNAADITLRALDILKNADIVACEDSRVTGKLMHLHGLKVNLTPYHEHNAQRVRPELIKHLKSGETVALVSDAGTPLIFRSGLQIGSGLPGCRYSRYRRAWCLGCPQRFGRLGFADRSIFIRRIFADKTNRPTAKPRNIERYSGDPRTDGIAEAFRRRARRRGAHYGFTFVCDCTRAH